VQSQENQTALDDAGHHSHDAHQVEQNKDGKGDTKKPKDKRHNDLLRWDRQTSGAAERFLRPVSQNA
jgi:hypothetical protein